MSQGQSSVYDRSNGEAVEEPLRPIKGQEGDQSGSRIRVPVRALLLPLVASWPLLLVGALIGPLLVAVAQTSTPAVYSAAALVVPIRTRTQVQFVPEIKTVTSETSPTTGGLTPERRQALIDLVHASRIEQTVTSQLAGQISPELLEPGRLQQLVSAATRPRSEILAIQTVASSPSDALLITNSWTRAYVNEVNRLYSGTTDLTAIETLRQSTEANLNAAEASLTQSLASSQLETLNQQISEREALLQLLVTPYQASGGSDSKTAGARSTTSSASLNDYRLVERRTLDDLSQTLRRVDATRQTVRALLAQPQVSETMTASDAAAITVVKSQLVAIDDGLPTQMQLQVPAAPASTSRGELQALAGGLDATRATLQTELDARRAAFEDKNRNDVATIQQQLQDLRVRREQADAERHALANARDRAAETYTAVMKKAAEEQVSSSAAGREVALASEAMHAEPVARRDINRLTSAALIGLALAAAVAYLRWFGIGPRRAIAAVHLRRSA